MVSSVRPEFPNAKGAQSRVHGDGRETIVGRDRELTALEQFRHEASNANGRLVLISGEAGIGKTTLTRKLNENAITDGAMVLAGACYDLSATPPYGPWLDLMRRYPLTDDLPPLPPFMSSVDDLANLSGPEALHTSAATFFRDLARIHPLVLILDDLHWADQPSLDLLRYLARVVQDEPILVVGAYRDDEVSRGHPLFRMIPTLVRESRTERIELRRLDPEHIRELISSDYELADDNLDALCSYLIEWSDGNPLFVQETLRTLELDGVLRQDVEGWRVGDLREAAIPNLIQQLIEVRLESISSRSAAAIRVAAVIGQHVPLALWESLTDAEALAKAIQEASANGLIQESSDLPGVGFRHALVREAIHATIPLHDRRSLHRRLADSLMQQARTDPDEIAYHLKQAGDNRSGEWLIRAGEQAERRFAWTEGFARYNEALGILSEIPGNEPTIAGLMLKTARLLRFLDPERANEYLATASRLAIDCGDEAIAAAARFNIGNNLCNLGDLKHGLREMSEAVETLVRSPEDAERISRWSQTSLPAQANPIQSWLGATTLMLATTGRFRDALAMGERSLRADWRETRSIDSSRLLATGTHSALDAYEGLGIAMAALGRPTDAKFAFDLSQEIHRRLNYGPSRVLVASIELVMNHFPYRATEIQERNYLIGIIEDHLRISSGMVGDQNSMWGFEHYLVHSGRWDELRQLIASGVVPTSYDYWFISMTARARLAWYEGNTERAWVLLNTLLKNGLDSSPDEHIHIPPAEPHRIAAGMAIEAGDSDLARVWMEAHDRWLDWSNAALGRAEGLLLWARIFSTNGDASSARDSAEAALESATEPEQPLALIGIHRFLGELSVSDGSLDEAERHFTISCELASASQLPYKRALSDLALAELALEQGRQQKARSLLVEVRETAAQLGAAAVHARADRLTESPHRKTADAADAPYGLTARELEVLDLLVQGMTDREIAERLYISHRTVMRHVSHILHKLDVESRTAAAARAVRDGIY